MTIHVYGNKLLSGAMKKPKKHRHIMYVFMVVYMYACAYACVYGCVYARMCVCLCGCMHACESMGMHDCKSMHICARATVYTHAHTQLLHKLIC